MAAKYILSALAAIFLLLALVRASRGGVGGDVQARTWLIVGVTFGLVSAWLWYRS